MKGDPADIRALAQDLDDVYHDHPNAISANPDLAADLLQLRKKTRERYEKIDEGRGQKEITPS